MRPGPKNADIIVGDTLVKRFLIGLLLIPMLALSACQPGERLSTANAPAAVEGLWSYTGLTTSSGQSLPLTGIFLFKDEAFLQQGVFNGEPFEEQGAMAHAGSYAHTAKGVDLLAEQTISIAPSRPSPLSFRPNTKHVLAVDRDGNRLKLVFGSGTVQTFERVGNGEGQVYNLSDGRLAFVDGYFILVIGNEKTAVSGYGRYTKVNDAYNLQIIRWSEATGTSARNGRDNQMTATFDGTTLTLADGRRLLVK